jgi:ABC-type sulfate transport system permease component
MILHVVFFLLVVIAAVVVAAVSFFLDPLSAVVATEEALEVSMASLEAAAAVFCLLLGQERSYSLSRRHFVLAVVVVSINRGCFPSFICSRGRISTS